MKKVLLRATVRGLGWVAPGATAYWLQRQLATPLPSGPRQFAPPAAPGTPLRIPFALGELAATRWGDGAATVLLVHGWGGTSRSFGPMVDALVARGFAAVAVDLPAHGDSSGRRTSLPECAHAVLRAGQVFGELHAVIAHSFGGAVATLAARSGLRLRRLALMAPPRSLLGMMSARARQSGVSTGLFARVAGNFAAQYQFDWAQLDTDRMVAGLTVPLLVVHDQADDVVPWADGAAVARSARSGTLLTTAGLGHRGVLAEPGVIENVMGFVVSR